MKRSPESQRQHDYLMQNDRNYRLAHSFGAPVIAMAALTAVGAGVLLEQANHSNSPEANANKINAEVKKDADILNGKVIVSAGVKFRSGPEQVNDSNADGSKGNVIGQVKPGEITVFDHPLVYTNQANQEFIGGLDKEGTFVWVAASELEKQQKSTDKTYIKTIMDENVGGEETHQGYFEDGRFYYEGDQEHVPVATISSMPESMEDQITFDMK